MRSRCRFDIQEEGEDLLDATCVSWQARDISTLDHFHGVEEQELASYLLWLHVLLCDASAEKFDSIVHHLFEHA